MSPEPRQLSGDELLDELEQRLAAVGGALEVLREIEQARNTPATIRTVVLTAAEPNWRDDVGEGQAANSIGLVNPTTVKVHLGIGGRSPTAAARGFSVPGECAIVLPVYAEDLVIGALSADLAAADAVVYLLRFAAVQPFAFGRYA